MNNNGNNKKKRFNLFDWYFKSGKDSSKSDINALKTPSFVNFFKLLWFKLGKFLTTNLIFIFGNFPIFFLLLGISKIFDTQSYSPAYATWGAFQSALPFSLENGSYVSSALIGIYGMHNDTSYKSIASLVFIAAALLLIFTWGFTKVGTTYIYRNIMSGDAVFPFSDFFYVIKRNVKQSLIFGALDIILIALLGFDVVFLIQDSANIMSMVFLFLTFAMIIMYLFMRPYVYIMIFTFDLKLTQIIKNALFFTILGIKRNFVMLLGEVALIAFNLGLLFIPFVTPVALILPFVITIALFDFIGVYCAYPNIIKFMMDEKDAKRIINRLPLEDDEDSSSDLEEPTTQNNA